ncbi:MAG TPA: SPASM domain-containing protein [Methanomicrobiales archaeon]|nr:SPASM domain-containing protein [Methanomicrobiales archaeon]
MKSLRGGCSAGRRVADIDPCGNVYPCQFARTPDFLVGSIRERPFSLLWADSSNPVLALFRNKRRKFNGRCGDCGYRDLCGGGCRIRGHAASGDFLAEDPFCFLHG